MLVLRQRMMGSGIAPPYLNYSISPHPTQSAKAEYCANRLITPLCTTNKLQNLPPIEQRKRGYNANTPNWSKGRGACRLLTQRGKKEKTHKAIITYQRYKSRIRIMLQLLWQSTSALHERFNNTSESLAHIAARWRKVEEEYEEFKHAQDNENLVEEAVDLMVTVIGVLQIEGVSLDQLQSAVGKVILKNGGKTEATHELKNHQIVRRK